MMNRTMQLNHSAALAVSCGSVMSCFAFYAACFFSALRFYFYYFFMQMLPSKRKLIL